MLIRETKLPILELELKMHAGRGLCAGGGGGGGGR